MGSVPVSQPEGQGSSEDFLKQLVASVFKPIYRWILSSSWITRAVVLGLLALGSLGWTNRTVVEGYAAFLPDIPSAVHNRKAVVLSADDDAQLQTSITKLTGYLGGELQNAAKPGSDHNVWTVSQIVVATSSRNPIDSSKIIEILHRKESTQCDYYSTTGKEPNSLNETTECYTEFAGGKHAHIVTAAWVAIAYARLGLPIPREQLNFLLRNQHDRGWWAPYPTSDVEEYASTFATSWSLLALHAQLSVGLVPAEDQKEVQAALDRGAAWLLSQEEEGARWSDFPYAKGLSKVSIGLSGLVLHTLHRLGADTADIDRQWLRNLPSDIPNGAASDDDNFPIEILQLPNSHTEQAQAERGGARQLRLPWTIIGTLDAYPHGNVLDRTRAIHLLRSIVESLPKLGQPVYTGMPFAAAELELSLRYLNGDTQKNADVI